MKDDMHRRMAYAFKRAAKAIAVTSSTTSVAFAANGASPIIPIRAFGIYAAIIVLVNYLMVVMVMPSIQIIYEIHFKHKCQCCDKKQDGDVEEVPKNKSTIDDNNKTDNDIEMATVPDDPAIVAISEDKKNMKVKEKKVVKEALEHTEAFKKEVKLASIKSRHSEYSNMYSSG